MSETAKAIQQRGAATEAAVTTYARSCFVCPASRLPVMQGTPADSCVRSGRRRRMLPRRWPGSIGYGRHMPHAKLLASGNPIDEDLVQSELAQLDVSAYRTIRLSAGNGAGSPGPVVIAISQIDQPGTPSANAIALVDSFTLAPGESASTVYEVLT